MYSMDDNSHEYCLLYYLLLIVQFSWCRVQKLSIMFVYVIIHDTLHALIIASEFFCTACCSLATQTIVHHFFLDHNTRDSVSIILVVNLEWFEGSRQGTNCE